MLCNATLPENQLTLEIKTQATSDIQNPAVDLFETYTLESWTIFKMNPLRKTVSQRGTKLEMSPMEGCLTDVSSIQPSLITQTRHFPVHDGSSIQGTIHDIGIQISSSELSEPGTQTEIESHSCFDQLKIYQAEQAPLSIEGILEIPNSGTLRNQESTKELLGKMYSEQLSGSRLPKVSELVEKNLILDRLAISKAKLIYSEAGTNTATPGEPPPQISMGLSGHEPITVSFEPEHSACCVESHRDSVHPLEQLSSCEQVSLIKEDGQIIADDTSDDEALPSEKKTGSIKS